VSVLIVESDEKLKSVIEMIIEFEHDDPFESSQSLSGGSKLCQKKPEIGMVICNYEIQDKSPGDFKNLSQFWGRDIPKSLSKSFRKKMSLTLKH
jgi:hypothetical protein